MSIKSLQGRRCTCGGIKWPQADRQLSCLRLVCFRVMLLSVQAYISVCPTYICDSCLTALVALIIVSEKGRTDCTFHLLRSVGQRIRLSFYASWNDIVMGQPSVSRSCQLAINEHPPTVTAERSSADIRTCPENLECWRLVQINPVFSAFSPYSLNSVSCKMRSDC